MTTKSITFPFRGGGIPTGAVSLMKAVQALVLFLLLIGDSDGASHGTAKHVRTRKTTQGSSSSSSSSNISSSSRSDTPSVARMLNDANVTDPPFSACDNKTAEEIRLEELLESLEAQLLIKEALVNETQANYTLSLTAYYNKDSIANATFDQVVLAEEDVDLKGNNTLNDVDAFLNVSDADVFFDSDYNSTLDSLNATMELVTVKNETYIQSLESGDPVAIETAESDLNATISTAVSSHGGSRELQSVIVHYSF